ncbi:Fungalysin/Thermolysin Extracellular metalloproteinase 5 [Dinochytrium kinnereticum]|nr:Fungalysin/Thermolysin Extracellular metalloproteinase 5 [Dinochytrium kinnereticum]
MLVLRSLLALAAAASAVMAHAPSADRPHSGVSFGPDLSKVHLREIGQSVSASMTLPRVASAGFAPVGKLDRLAPVSAKEAVKVAQDYTLEKLTGLMTGNVMDDGKHSVVVTDSYTSEHTGITHVYLVQTVDGIEIVNGVANVNVDKHGQILSFSSSFYHGSGAPGVASPSDEVPMFRDQQQGHRIQRRHRGNQHHKVHHKEHHHKEHHKAHHIEHEESRHRHNKHADDDHHHRKHDSKKFAEFGAAPSSSSSHSTKLTPEGDIISPEEALLAFSKELGLGIGSHHVVETEPFDSSLQPASRTDPDFNIRLEATLSANAATTSAPRHLPDSVPAKFKYMQTSEGTLVPVWDLQVDLLDNWFNVQVHATDRKVVQLVDWVSDAAYNVLPLGINDPESGDRVMVLDPAHPVSSPHGWHMQVSLESSKKAKNFTVTVGNNVYAHENLDGKNEWKNKIRPDGKKDLIFDFPLNLTIQEPSEYIDAAVTNLFYWNNAIHDLFYLYGFTEKAGNFQEDNLGRGGEGGDAVIANAQDGSGYNNANFATPPDGGHGRMRMYAWSVTTPYRDGDMEGGIIMHEYAHGISIRLTGGPKNSGCLGWGEAGGMGEGWGDFFATILRTTPNTTRDAVFGMGEYSNGGSGIRKYRYSTSKSINPSTYSYVSKPAYWGVHAKGEVWAEILYEMYWDLVDAHGYNPNWYDTPIAKNAMVDRFTTKPGTYRDFKTGKVMSDTSFSAKSAMASGKWTTGGNVLALQLVVDGLKLQPCYPSFVDARDAILLADEALTKGENACIIWGAFARRGLGAGAKAGGREAFDLPKKC